MVLASDFLLADDGDLIITDAGDIAVGFSDEQHVQHILLAYPGYYRNSLLCGVGLQSYENSTGMELTVQRSVRIQLERDNYSINKVAVVTNPNFKITTDVDRIL